MLESIKLGKLKILKVAWSLYKKLNVWWKVSSIDGQISVDEFTNLWQIFGEIYEELTGKKLVIRVMENKALKAPSGQIKRNIKIREESVS